MAQSQIGTWRDTNHVARAAIGRSCGRHAGAVIVRTGRKAGWCVDRLGGQFDVGLQEPTINDGNHFSAAVQTDRVGIFDIGGVQRIVPCAGSGPNKVLCLKGCRITDRCRRAFEGRETGQTQIALLKRGLADNHVKARRRRTRLACRQETGSRQRTCCNQ